MNLERLRKTIEYIAAKQHGQNVRVRILDKSERSSKDVK